MIIFLIDVEGHLWSLFCSVSFAAVFNSLDDGIEVLDTPSIIKGCVGYPFSDCQQNPPRNTSATYRGHNVKNLTDLWVEAPFQDAF
jgi:hypothetical protein